MSKYDELDAYTELEQSVAEDLDRALAKRGFTVTHNGTSETHAPGGRPDIIAESEELVLLFEVTKRKKSQQDDEFQRIRDHLVKTKERSGGRHCFCVFSSPETAMRTIDSIRDFNLQRDAEGAEDMKILPLVFETLELWCEKLTASEKDLYPIPNLLKVFQRYDEYADDLRVRKLLIEEVFPHDELLSEQLEEEEKEHDRFTLESLIDDLDNMANYMRENGIATAQATVDTVIYLVFLKLFEEKREANKQWNRLRSVEDFKKYQGSIDEKTRLARRAIHKLFQTVRDQQEFIESEMFTSSDVLPSSLTDDFIEEYFIPTLRYRFYGTRIDALGAVYEVLSRRASKDVRIGQFFTPENVVSFMVQLAELQPNSHVLDPACGTGRFLIYSMHDMLQKIKKTAGEHIDKENESREIRYERLWGADIDSRIAKLAKMNMWIHDDGKSNILGGSNYNGLTLYSLKVDKIGTFEETFDHVLTNPPLGDLNYQNIDFVGDDVDKEQRTNHTLELMPILPFKSETRERRDQIADRLKNHKEGLTELLEEAEDLKSEVVEEWEQLNQETNTKENRTRKKELERRDDVRSYKSLLTRIKSKRQTIDKNKELLEGLDAQIRAGIEDKTITGNKMKGGALFLSSIWHYLKPNAFPSAPPEWRGGKLLTILDEGILNTDDYSDTRDFLRTHFYIKAIISLTRDAFVPVSSSTTKTSILYATKKTDLQAKQKEPIFFAHAEKVGLTTTGKVCENHLESILASYMEFQEAIKNSYVDQEFLPSKFEEQDVQIGDLNV